MVLLRFKTFIRVLTLFITVETGNITQVFAASAIGNYIAFRDQGTWVLTVPLLLPVLLFLFFSRFLVRFLGVQSTKLQKVGYFKLIRSLCEFSITRLTLEILRWSGLVRRLSNSKLNGTVTSRAVLVYFTNIGARPDFGRDFIINRSFYYLSEAI